jgi:hypothetical protein
MSISFEPGEVGMNDFPSSEKSNQEHEVNKAKLPEVLQQLPWEEMTSERLDEGWYDGAEVMVAVPVRWRCGDWYYEIWVVEVRVDERYFAVNHYGEPWGWELDDADLFIRLN